jgi:nitrogenase molybdenum-iron protein alpha/beta subunit
MWSVPYDLSIDTARADALFASVLQISDAPSAVQVKQAIDAATSTHGDLGCAARVAQEFGEHPETAVTRMRWAREEVAVVFGGSPSGTSYAPQHLLLAC